MTYEGNCRLGDLFTSRREKGRSGLPTLSVTLSDGLVNREDLDRKQDTSLAPEEHLLVKPGDIAYNMMRMWQGASGLADQEGLVSPAYVILRPNSRIDPLYASYLFKTKRMVYLFWAYSYGITDDRLRLYSGDFARIPVCIPPIGEQRRIAIILKTWDKTIRKTQELLECESALSEHLLRTMTTAGLRLATSKNTWREFTLGSLGKTYGGLTGKSKEDFGHGKPYIPYKNIFKSSRVDTNDLEYVEIGTEESQTICRKGDIFFTSSSETPEELGMASVLLDDIEELYLNSFCIGFRLSNFQTLLPQYARFLFRGPVLRISLNRLAQGYTRFNLSKKELMKQRVMLPSLPEQQEISELLAASQEKVEALRKTLICLEQEKLALSDRLIGRSLTSQH